MALCRCHGRVATVALRSTRRAEAVLGCGDRDRVGPPARLRLARAPEGFVRSVLALLGADLDAPDHTTRSRRSQQIAALVQVCTASA